MQNAPEQAPLILASNSPRRRELLTRAGLWFRVVPSRIDESRIALSAPAAYARKLAHAKAREVSQRHPAAWVLGADTIVVCDDDILGKPSSAQAARRMLRQLSGRPHRVITGFAVCCKARNHTSGESVETQVTFKILTEQEIECYIRTGEPFDKAGGYGIQSLGARLVSQIEGSYTNVVGLPVNRVIDHLVNIAALPNDPRISSPSSP